MKTITIILSLLSSLFAMTGCDEQQRLTPLKTESIGWAKLEEMPRRLENLPNMWQIKFSLSGGVPRTAFYPASEELIGYKPGDEVEIFNTSVFDEDNTQNVYFVRNFRRRQ